MASTESPHICANKGAQETTPLVLEVPMHIIPELGSLRSVSSPTPFLINGVKVWSAAPIHIYACKDQQDIRIEPTDRLDSEFAQGWDKLPDELKTRILAFNLVCSSFLGYLSLFSHYGEDATSYYHHLRTTPEIAAFAREIYYTENTFEVKFSRYSHIGHYWPRDQYFAYPVHRNNGMIRNLVVVSSTSDLNCHYL